MEIIDDELMEIDAVAIDEELEEDLELENGEVFDTLRRLRVKASNDEAFLKDLKAFEGATCSLSRHGFPNAFSFTKERVEELIRVELGEQGQDVPAPPGRRVFLLA